MPRVKQVVTAHTLKERLTKEGYQVTKTRQSPESCSVALDRSLIRVVYNHNTTSKAYTILGPAGKVGEAMCYRDMLALLKFYHNYFAPKEVAK